MQEKKSKRLIKLLENGWISNWQACYELKSAHADRWIRKLRANPPVGYIIEERKKHEKIDGYSVHYKEYRLIKNVLQNN